MWDPDPGLAGAGVVVTGGAGGIGRAVCGAFASLGARVCVLDVSQTEAEAVAGELPGAHHAAVAADLVQVAEHPELLARIAEALGQTDVLVHLAAVLRRHADPAAVTEEDWDFQVDTNLKAGFFLNVAMADAWRARRQPGAIVNCSSQGWWSGGFGGSVVYNAAKGGVVTMTRGLARAYAPHGIRVNAVAPGLVRTPMMMKDPSAVAGLGKMLELVPMQRLAEPGEIAGAIVFLAGGHASYVTGATINVSGGFLMY